MQDLRFLQDYFWGFRSSRMRYRVGEHYPAFQSYCDLPKCYNIVQSGFLWHSQHMTVWIPGPPMHNATTVRQQQNLASGTFPYRDPDHSEGKDATAGILKAQNFQPCCSKQRASYLPNSNKVGWENAPLKSKYGPFLLTDKSAPH